MRKLLIAAFRFLASSKLAVVLLALLAAILAVTTIVEAAKGEEYVQWYVYHQPWFSLLLGLLGANILAAMVVRFPWKRSQAGFVLAHAGLLVLLVGAFQTLEGKIEGQLALEEGESNDKIVLHDTSCFRVQWIKRQGRPEDQPTAIFAFQPGPVDWPSGETRELGTLSGVRLKLLRFLAHARMEEDWIVDESAEGAPALRFAYSGPDNMRGDETWLVAGPFGAAVTAGSANISFQKTAMDSLVEDFLRPPPAKGMDRKGVLSIHYDGRMMRLLVSENLGKKISVPRSGILVEIAEYLPNAEPDKNGRFTSRGDRCGNPLLELRVHLPGKKEPIRQIAFAKLPFLSLDGMHSRTSPVKFWYHHPDIVPEPGAEFMTTPNGKLYCRLSARGRCEPQGEVRSGDKLKAWAGSTISVIKFLPHARRDARFHSVLASPDDGEPAPAAAQVEVDAGGVTQQLWLARNAQEETPQTLSTPEGTLRIAFGYDVYPLGFALRLRKFTRGLNPGGMGNASFSSAVQVLDASGGVRKEEEISMNRPLMHDRFTFYQSSVTRSEHGSVLGVAHDPGGMLKYLGCAMICLGTLVMFLKRTDRFGAVRFLASSPRDFCEPRK